MVLVIQHVLVAMEWEGLTVLHVVGQEGNMLAVTIIVALSAVDRGTDSASRVVAVVASDAQHAMDVVNSNGSSS